MITMNDDVRALWIKALRSGEYKQTKECLNDGVGYCCLGVLCDIYQKQHPDTSSWINATNPREFQVRGFDEHEYEVDTTYPPLLVGKWAGLEYKDMVALGELNDDRCFTFNQIADIVERD